MAATAQTAPGMARPKADKPKTAVISLRTFPEVREAVEEYARLEHRTLAQAAELLLREGIISRRKREKQPSKDIEALP